jgi:hypothetical protein
MRIPLRNKCSFITLLVREGGGVLCAKELGGRCPIADRADYCYNDLETRSYDLTSRSSDPNSRQENA